MSIRRFFDSPRARRGLAASVVVLSLGGLVLARAPHTAATPLPGPMVDFDSSGEAFRGPGMSGRVALSHGQVMAGESERVFAELRLKADQVGAVERAPLSMVVVLDTSGSMIGEKMSDAKESVARLIAGMDDDDEIALVRYATNAELIQPMARVGDVRRRLLREVEELDAAGGTNIPWALRKAAEALRSAGDGRVQRLVLVSDGLDDTQAQSEQIARANAARGVTISALGIGLDFDEGYLSAVARQGHGNFAFVEDPSTLANFLDRELRETATTTVTDVTARLRLPAGVRLVRAVGADVAKDGRNLDLSVGALHAGDMRRVVLELEVDAEPGATLDFRPKVAWRTVTGKEIARTVEGLALTGSDNAASVYASRDRRVWARAIGAFASLDQLDAIHAYNRGDRGRAGRLIDRNLRLLEEAANEAPGEEAESIRRQISRYKTTAGTFATAPADSPEARSAAKSAAEQDNSNLARPSF